jgi:hypothetical protein
MSTWIVCHHYIASTSIHMMSIHNLAWYMYFDYKTNHFVSIRFISSLPIHHQHQHTKHPSPCTVVHLPPPPPPPPNCTDLYTSTRDMPSYSRPVLFALAATNTMSAAYAYTLNLGWWSLGLMCVAGAETLAALSTTHSPMRKLVGYSIFSANTVFVVVSAYMLLTCSDQAPATEQQTANVFSVGSMISAAAEGICLYAIGSGRWQ